MFCNLYRCNLFYPLAKIYLQFMKTLNNLITCNRQVKYPFDSN